LFPQTGKVETRGPAIAPVRAALFFDFFTVMQAISSKSRSIS
jgi:hypothetical protein